MSTFTLVMFWGFILGAVISLIRMVGDHPRMNRITVGEDCANLVLNVACIAWTAYLLWGAK